MHEHVFADSLEKSKKNSYEYWWVEVYKQFFYGFANFMSVHGNCAAQKQGIDRIVVMKNGKTYFVEEKVRYVSYPDFLFEYVSAEGNGFSTPGWIEKDLCVDFIAYAFLPRKECIFLPWIQLKKAWESNKKEWKKEYELVDSKNTNYKSNCCCVPRRVVWQQMIKESESKWE